MAVEPFALKDAPSLIERLLPVQKLSIESFKENQAVHGKTLTALGSYWKGRKVLILNRACILGALLPASDNPKVDLEIFELLMGMDIDSIQTRLSEKLSGRKFSELKAQGFPLSYLEMVGLAKRPEECNADLYETHWERINLHLGTSAKSLTELVEQLGIMRFGHRPKVVDTFSGSGQIPFEAARLGCDVIASDLSPVAAMLTWGNFNIVGGSKADQQALKADQRELIETVQKEIDSIGVEEDDRGWRGKVYLYCVETICPQTKWRVPMLPKLVVSKGYRVVAKLVPVPQEMRYDIEVVSNATDEELKEAETGTVVGENLVHSVDGVEYRTPTKTIRGDYRIDGKNSNALRMWEKSDFVPRIDDIFQERLYAIQWIPPKDSKVKSEFRSVTEADLERERVVETFIREHLVQWQADGWIPDMKIEPGDETERLQRERGWTYWHHLFNPRQLLIGGLINQHSDARLKFGLAQELNWNSRLSRWNSAAGGGGMVADTFYSQALNTLYNYGTRGFGYASPFLGMNYKSFPLDKNVYTETKALPASSIATSFDIAITDPPYGDAVKYEEIYEFFIAWLRKNPPPEFANWTWDSRRALAIKGEDHEFKTEMINAYRHMTDLMADNGLQIIMFTHQSGDIWSDMAGIVWASGLQVTAAWYVVTETESALRDGSYVKGTVLLVCRKRMELLSTTRGDLAFELEEEVKRQIEDLTGLSQGVKDNLYRGENLFQDADLQMAGYAAALRVLTKYAVINGQEMEREALAPRVRGQSTLVDQLIAFAVDLANSHLIPEGISFRDWNSLVPEERFYLKMCGLEAQGASKLDNYQNFAKAFKVADFHLLMGASKANAARLKFAQELKRTGIPGSATLTGILQAIAEIQEELDGDVVLTHLVLSIPEYFNRRDQIQRLISYLGEKRSSKDEAEGRAARILATLVSNQRFG